MFDEGIASGIIRSWIAEVRHRYQQKHSAQFCSGELTKPLRPVCQVLMYALVASTMLAAMLGSSMSTFGVEVCNGSGTEPSRKLCVLAPPEILVF